jgi:hypothetical protein
MRRPEEIPHGPEVEATLEAIDATLAGEPVDPRFAEMAELALLVAAERPRPRPAFTDALDARVARRFAPAAAPAPPARPGWLRAWGWASAATVAVAVAVLVVVLQSGPHLGGSATSSSSARPSAPAPGVASAAGAAGSAPSGQDQFAPSSPRHSLSSAASGALSLPPNGRKTIQSAEIDLAAAPNAIERVSQEVLNVVGAENGIVDRSNVTQTGGLDGSASFALRIPSQNLAPALGRLSQLPGASVLSRTDNSQDVNSQYVSSTRALADAQALRAALVRQLAAATTTAELDSLQARLSTVEGTISADTAALRNLTSQIDYAQVTVTISARANPVPPPHSSRGFTLGHAVHVAGRVLVVAAGVALIALAALLPVALVVLLLAWLAAALRRRRREQALDLA